MPSRPTARLAAAAALVAGAALIAPMAAIGAAENQKVPPRHVICKKAQTWIPIDYSGGCYLVFSQAVRQKVMADFEKVASTGSQWAANPSVVPLVPAWKTMRCQRGGQAGLVKLNRWQAGTCTFTTTFAHRGYDEHPDHEWECTVEIVVRTSLNGSKRIRNGKIWLQWDVSAVPNTLDAVAGEFPNCEKSVPDDAWTSG
ncbi:MAG: hypothetical protein ACKOGE_06850 [Actinomycetota bacterium]